MEPKDFSSQYNTALSPEQEKKFLEWQKKNPSLGNTFDYDARGFWLAGAETAKNNHGADTYKKPNHPTFSSGSMYHTAQTPGGAWSQGPDKKWTFTPSSYNLQQYSPDELKRYWDKVELPEGNVLALPTTPASLLEGAH